MPSRVHRSFHKIRPVGLLDLSEDTMLQVMWHLAIPDLRRLLQTCRHIRDEPTFWIPLVEATRALYPIGCPKYANLSQYDSGELQDLVSFPFKLQKNWNLEFPKFVDMQKVTSFKGCVETLFNDGERVDGVDIIGLVPGTDIVVLHTTTLKTETKAVQVPEPETRTRTRTRAKVEAEEKVTVTVTTRTGHLVCWDSKLAAPFPLPPIEVGGQLNHVSAPSESAYGVYSFVVLGGNAKDPNPEKFGEDAEDPSPMKG
ncbi:hypothetical protein FB45DRAFT_1102149 [Roridomyces roridus]|uniref:F-box domain-containing protein n=1 Tax=Roridomyces roridus TaxID=1738132 RepID=A0AAD7G0Z7_9AGAR|nr:hypothetical protein FB45DRAFT_1102149 [Roridomyces roridus]